MCDAVTCCWRTQSTFTLRCTLPSQSSSNKIKTSLVSGLSVCLTMYAVPDWNRRTQLFLIIQWSGLVELNSGQISVYWACTPHRVVFAKQLSRWTWGASLAVQASGWGSLIICVPPEQTFTPLWPHLTPCHSAAKWGNHARGDCRFGPYTRHFSHTGSLFTLSQCLHHTKNKASTLPATIYITEKYDQDRAGGNRLDVLPQSFTEMYEFQQTLCDTVKANESTFTLTSMCQYVTTEQPWSSLKAWQPKIPASE